MTPCARCNSASTSTLRTDTEILILCCRCSDRWFNEWTQRKQEDGRYTVMAEDFHANWEPDYIPYFEFQITGE